MAETESMTFSLTLEQIEDYEFRIKFDHPAFPEIRVDEPEPLGKGRGPNASRLLAAAVANCLSASLLFCVRKFKQDPGGIRTTVVGRLVRNEKGRLRIGDLAVEIRLGAGGESLQHLERCIAQFEDFCVVTDSVRKGIPVAVKVLDAAGRTLYQR